MVGIPHHTGLRRVVRIRSGKSTTHGARQLSQKGFTIIIIKMDHKWEVQIAYTFIRKMMSNRTTISEESKWTNVDL